MDLNSENILTPDVKSIRVISNISDEKNKAKGPASIILMYGCISSWVDVEIQEKERLSMTSRNAQSSWRESSVNI